MLAQKQPNTWSCLPTAFAIIADLPINDLIVLLKHDGKKCDRIVGFSPQEILWHLQDHWYISEYNEGIMVDSQGVWDEDDLMPPGMPSLQERVKLVMERASGVYAYTTWSGGPHAVAWDHIGRVFIDPKNGDTLHSVEGEVEVFWSMEPRCSEQYTGGRQDH